MAHQAPGKPKSVWDLNEGARLDGLAIMTIATGLARQTAQQS
jgi:hypothetical protein